MTQRAKTMKVRDEGFWKPVVDGEVIGTKFVDKSMALQVARGMLIDRFALEPGEERLVKDIAKELGVPRSYVESIPEDRNDYHLHVGDGINGATFARPKRDYTLFRDFE